MEQELTGFGEFEGVELLQKLHLFQKLSFEETQRLGQLIEYVDVPAEAVVIEQNSLGSALYVLAKGEAKVSRASEVEGAEGAEVAEEIGRISAGDVFGEMSLVDDLLTSARVSTVTPCRLLKIPRDRFEALISSDDKLAIKVYRSFCRTLSDRLRRTSSLLARHQALALIAR